MDKTTLCCLAIYSKMNDVKFSQLVNLGREAVIWLKVR
ncbi:AlpA family phage regulatory protein [Vibrio cholerae]|nr:AlpA family phage regulatory protein [Vibrio cholerae]